MVVQDIIYSELDNHPVSSNEQVTGNIHICNENVTEYIERMLNRR
jgi:hypothetical protein